ncbi:hypothetical protein JCM17039_06730 [Blautia glucerasea]
MGLDFGFMMEYLPWYVDAARLTVKIAFWGILIALATAIWQSL